MSIRASVAVTTTYVVERAVPVLEVTHELDPEDGSSVWQFHCGNGDYDPGVLRLVSIQQILDLDASVEAALALPAGSEARRASPSAPWVISPLQHAR
jgi:hypothetical protein